MQQILVVGGMFALIVLGLLVAAEFRWSANYVEDEVTSGEAWGVVVGDSAAETLRKLQAKESASQSRLVIYRSVDPKSELIDPLLDARPDQLEGANRISVLDGQADVSELTIELENGVVARVHMRRRGFDL